MKFKYLKLCLPGLIGLLLATFASAQSGEKDSRLHADGPGGWGVQVSHEIAAPEGRFRNIDVPTLTAFLPGKNASAGFKGTAFIVCPGGGYKVCDFDHHGIRLADQLNRAGIDVFVLTNLFETGGHGNFTPGGQNSGGQWPTLLLDWLRKGMPSKQKSLP